MAANQFMTIDKVKASLLMQSVYRSKAELDKKLARTTFLEAIGKQRSETIFSAFLKWFFENADFNKTSDSSPLMYLLRLLASAAVQQEDAERKADGVLMDSELRDKILIGDIIVSVSDISAKTEVQTDYDKGDGDKENGKIDLVLIFTLKSKRDSNYVKRVRILLENKVDSEEGKNKAKKKVQCEKYYGHFSDKSKECNQGIDINTYVFLSIEKPKKISSPYFIMITYQDLLDHILSLVMVHAVSYSASSVAYLKEFIDTITTLKNNGRCPIAKDSDTQQLLKNFYDVNKAIIDTALLAGCEYEEFTKASKPIHETNKYLLDLLKDFYTGNKDIIEAAVLAGCENEKIKAAINKAQKSHNRDQYELSYGNHAVSEVPVSNVVLRAIEMLKKEGMSANDIEAKLTETSEKLGKKLGEVWIDKQPDENVKRRYTDEPIVFNNGEKRWVNTNHWDKNYYFPILLDVLEDLGFVCEKMKS